MALPDRTSTILTFIVDDYISSAMPVSSNAVAKSGALNVSSATIRNEMGILIEEGYLLRPHSSSGAIPSEKGYRHFVGGLDFSSPPPEGLVSALKRQMDITPDDIDAWVQIAASVIADLIGALAFITAPRAKMPDVKQIELLRLHDMLVMLVLVLQEARVYRHVIELKREIPRSGNLNALATKYLPKFRGKTSTNSWPAKIARTSKTTSNAESGRRPSMPWCMQIRSQVNAI